jgi:hypothetical protein
MSKFRLASLVLASLLFAACGKGCAEKGDTPSDGPAGDEPAAADAQAEPGGDAPVVPDAPKVEVMPLPPPQNDLQEVSVTDKRTNEERTFKIGDRVGVAQRVGMISQRFNGVSDVVVEPPHKGTVKAIRTEGGLLDIEWDPGKWRKHVAPPPADPDAPAAPADLGKQEETDETVNLGSFVSPVHAAYLVHEGSE